MKSRDILFPVIGSFVVVSPQIVAKVPQLSLANVYSSQVNLPTTM